ncbi:RNA polymerase II transcription factor SIII subunit A-domain-containing protein [Gongronella butleri]|nr:RNA polymerase II transcription factor SIII subunit A-domain-containing protein [Gongronella butleri]
MPKQVKSLVSICQDTLSMNIDGLGSVGDVPYALIKQPLKRATPQQLLHIERCNPHLVSNSNELWLDHILQYADLRHEWNQGNHQDPTSWRDVYLNRHREMEERKKKISEKIKNQYHKIQNEKAARSIKILKGVAPPMKRSVSRKSTESSSSSRLFLETKKAASKTSAIYSSRIPARRPVHVATAAATTTARASIKGMPAVTAIHARAPPRTATPPIVPVDKPPSRLQQAYHANFRRFAPAPTIPNSMPLIPPSAASPLNCTSTSEHIQHWKTHTTKKPAQHVASNSSATNPQSKKPTAIVNFGLFQELS